MSTIYESSHCILDTSAKMVRKMKVDHKMSKPVRKNTSFQSLFHYPIDWINSNSPAEQRKGFIEPQGYITREGVRDKVIGDAWIQLDDSSLNSRLDIAVSESIRSTPSPIKGKITVCAENSAESLNVEDDRMCSLKNREIACEGRILQLSPLRKNSEDVGCYAYVCIDNSFITHAPYMSVKNVPIIYDILIGIEGDAEWVDNDLKKWWKGTKPEKPLTFGRFFPLSAKLIVPSHLALIWSDSFAPVLTKWFSNNHSKIAKDDNITGVVSLEEGQACIHFKSLLQNHSGFERIELGSVSIDSKKTWPVHILQHRILLTGAPIVSSLKPSLNLEVNVLQSEFAKYTSTLCQVEQIKAYGLWCFERIIQMYTAQQDGYATESSPFKVFKIDYSKVFRPKVNDFEEDMCKGSGLPIITGNPQYDAVCDGLLLKGISRSPMNVANSLQYNRFVFGKDLGTPLSYVDSLFLFDYGGDWTMPSLRTWLDGLREKIAEVHAIGSNGEKSLLECTILSYEVIRAKKRFEDAMRRRLVKLENICVWKDFRELILFRALDAAFIKSTVTSSHDEEAYYVTGFATVIHDLCDYGYDLSICECSGMLFTLGAVDGSFDSIEYAYAVTLAGVRYISKVHRHTSSGLTLASTHYWQLCNGRHRFLNCAMSVAEHEHPRRLAVKGTLLDTIYNRNTEEYISSKHDHELCLQIYQSLGERCKNRGNAFPTLLRAIVARPYERIYKKSLDDVGDLVEVDCITSIIDSVCADSSNDAIDLLWDILCFMWDETAIMWHTLLGSLLIVSDRFVADDTAGFGYSERLWKREG
ncbi:uncharacterized protein LOC119068023 [Bradysia coprophila]|uniref:uncharacterized protein LOC119068023 n=1 Tax=Bradysia coprophila TaxID=38358 RepID=UPI00187DCD19|nr:uncharacterized protein LOC119068023 [Bradysia coprophila]